MLSTRPRATDGGENRTYLALNKAAVSELLPWPMREGKRKAAKRDELKVIPTNCIAHLYCA